MRDNSKFGAEILKDSCLLSNNLTFGQPKSNWHFFDKRFVGLWAKKAEGTKKP